MAKEIKYIIAEFEKEVWLYLDNDLSPEKMKYWNEQISAFSELKNFLDENKSIIEAYNELPLNQLSDSKYSEILSFVVKKKNWLSKFFSTINPFSQVEGQLPSSVKLAFGGTFAVAAIVILLLVNKPNPVKDISLEILDWNADKITDQIGNVEATISFIKNDDIRKFLLQQKPKDKMDQDIYSISNQIEKMKNEMNDNSL